MTNEEGSMETPKRICDDYKDVRYYNIKKHERAIIILMIVVFICIILATPWIIATIELLFRQIPGWGDFNNNTNIVFNIGVLPDFLGGAVGILAGFVMEWKFFNQLKLLEKYKTLTILLQQELGGIYWAFEEQLKDKVFWLIREYVLDDIILNAENNVVIHDIHKFPFSKKGEIYKLLLNIYGHIEKFNMTVKELAELTEEDKLEKVYKILYNIGTAIAGYTGYSIISQGNKQEQDEYISDYGKIDNGVNQLKIEAKELIAEVREEIEKFFIVTGANINDYKHKELLT